MNTPSLAVKSFNVIADTDASLLILGSMPGIRSLEAQEYYAHPRNAFWDIMAQLFELEREAPYAQRLNQLKKENIALWDVAHQCVRPGSLDANIDQQSVIPNDIPGLLAECPQLKTLCFNGKAAEQLFKRHFKALYVDPSLNLICLPSTSPAHASLAFADKLEAWATIKSITEKARSKL